MKKYIVALNFPLDPNVESALYTDGILVTVGNYGDENIVVETELDGNQLFSLCDIAYVIEV
jgi:hypothetical protein